MHDIIPEIWPPNLDTTAVYILEDPLVGNLWPVFKIIGASSTNRRRLKYISLRASLCVTEIELDRVTARSQPTEDAKAPVNPAAWSHREERLHSSMDLFRTRRYFARSSFDDSD